MTKGQSENTLSKITTSNFEKVIKCTKNPDGLLKAMFYSEPKSIAISYGKENEMTAIKAYVDYMKSKGSNITVIQLVLF